MHTKYCIKNLVMELKKYLSESMKIQVKISATT